MRNDLFFKNQTKQKIKSIMLIALHSTASDTMTHVRYAFLKFILHKFVEQRRKNHKMSSIVNDAIQ